MIKFLEKFKNLFMETKSRVNVTQVLWCMGWGRRGSGLTKIVKLNVSLVLQVNCYNTFLSLSYKISNTTCMDSIEISL